MAALGPFETAPHLAVAVSGGADSLALCLLTDAWARGRGGRTTALIVDHGLRSGSDTEARAVAERLAARDIAAVILPWRGPKPTRRIQATAREARYRLLGEWCREIGVLHLLLGHHREDQAETLLLRLARGSGLDGLAAMAAIVEGEGLRLLRPLLEVPGARLRATLVARGLDWIEDTSNADPRFARARLRDMAGALEREGLSAARLAATARDLARARQALDKAVAGLLAETVEIDPAGFAWLDPAPFAGAAPEIARRALIRLLGAIGGGVYPPRGDRLDRLFGALRAGGPDGGRTLAGCRLIAHRGRVLVCREPAAAKDETPFAGDAVVVWDNRFRVSARRRFPEAETVLDGTLVVRRLGNAWRGLDPPPPGPDLGRLPAPVRPALPAIFGLDGLVAIPHLSWERRLTTSPRWPACVAEFRPPRPLAPASFAFASRPE